MRTIVASVGSALSVLAVVVSAHAQALTPPQPDPVRLQLARDVLMANGGAQAAEARLRAIFSGAIQLSVDAQADKDSKTAATVAAVMKGIADEEVKAIPQLLDQTATIYANNLTERELRDMLAWTLSPSSQSIRGKMGTITAQLMAEQGPLLTKLVGGSAAAAVDRACAEEKCTPDQRRQIGAMIQPRLPAH